MGSLFDGIGGFPLGASRYGITAIWASEIEPFPIEVTKVRFPEMVHVGDITQLDGSTLPPVDLITGGSPCQDLSVANGNRQGLAGARSGLFMEQIRVTREMRKESERRGTDEFIRPRYLVWENVPGAFSSNDSEDFRVVLEEIVRIADDGLSVPRPETGTWKSAGAILGTKFSLAWRVLDARNWLPQRRKRIYLVADLGGHTAPKISFEQRRLFGDSAPGAHSPQSSAADAESGADDSGGSDAGATVAVLTVNLRDDRRAAGGAGQSESDERHGITQQMTDCLTPWDTQHSRIADENGCAPTLSGSNEGKAPGGLLFASFSGGAGAKAATIGYREDEAPTLKGGSGGNQVPSVICINDQGGEFMDISEDTTGTLRAHAKGHEPLIYENNGVDGRYSGPLECAPTVLARYGTGGNNLPLVADSAESYCIAGNTIDREPENGGNGNGVQTELAYTLTRTDVHAIFARNMGVEFRESDVASTETAHQAKDSTDLVVYGQAQYSQYAEGGDLSTLRASGGSNGGGSENLVCERAKLIRRLTPLECERLQGFPDHWTDLPGASDSARYRALGNSVAIPCVELVMRGIAYYLQQIYDGTENVEYD
jgi:DNA (cytosine-5)-methyltransferase 1